MIFPKSHITFASMLLLAGAAYAQSGFPFTDETLKYNVNWPSGLSLGEATFAAHHGGGATWDFDLTMNASIPGYSITDHFHSAETGDLCSTEFMRDLSQGGKKSREKTTFDQAQNSAHRVTLMPADGGESTIHIPTCARDALTYIYYARRELGQGRLPAAQTIYFGGGYSIRTEYPGAQNITSNGKSTVTDHLVVSIQGPKSNFSFDVFYARDAARTPLQIRIPLPVGSLLVELAP